MSAVVSYLRDALSFVSFVGKKIGQLVDLLEHTSNLEMTSIQSLIIPNLFMDGALARLGGFRLVLLGTKLTRPSSLTDLI